VAIPGRTPVRSSIPNYPRQPAVAPPLLPARPGPFARRSRVTRMALAHRRYGRRAGPQFTSPSDEAARRRAHSGASRKGTQRRCKACARAASIPESSEISQLDLRAAGALEHLDLRWVRLLPRLFAASRERGNGSVLRQLGLTGRRLENFPASRLRMSRVSGLLVGGAAETNAP